jgi:pyruvate dehydrogenase E1 component alpha subunit
MPKPNHEILAQYPILNSWNPQSPEMIQVMNEHGEIVNPDLRPNISDQEILEIYFTMLKIRIADEKCINMQRQGRMGTYPSVYGQEACQIGAVHGLQKSDWLVPTFRESGMMWYKGVPLEQVMLYWIGNEKGSEFAADTNVLPVAITVGGHLPHATGIGWAERLKKGNDIVICSFSDGATSEGDFHAALNFAAVFKARTVFFCQNNQYAISTSRNIQTMSNTIAEKAFAYGLPGIQVDGNDVLALIRVMQETTDLARKHHISSLVEAVTYRLGDHTTSDNSKLYREDSEVEAWKPKDPVIRLQKYLTKQGLLTPELEEKVKQEAKTFVEVAVKKALNTEDPKLDDMFKYILSETYPELEEQRLQLIQEYTNN